MSCLSSVLQAIDTLQSFCSRSREWVQADTEGCPSALRGPACIGLHMGLSLQQQQQQPGSLRCWCRT